jgi:proline racemase
MNPQTPFPAHCSLLAQSIDSHTAGEATRLIVAGLGPIPGTTIIEKQAYFRTHLDHIRLLLTQEPRGHRDLLAAALTEPVTPGAAFGLIYMDVRRYPHLCGHATIGAVTTLLECGHVPLPEADRPDRTAAGTGPRPQEQTLHQTAPQMPQGTQSRQTDLDLVVDTPAGPMPVTAHIIGRRVQCVSFTTVPCFVLDTDLPLNIPLDIPLNDHLDVPLAPAPDFVGQSDLRIHLVYVGGFFALVDLDQPALRTRTLSHGQLVDLGMRIIEQANVQHAVTHPSRPEASTVDVVEFFRHTDPHQGRGLVVYGDHHLDRSPCGTGTAAKLTLLHHLGRLDEDARYVNHGPLDTTFTARIHEKTRIGPHAGVTVRITGSAHITGRHEFVLDERDPFTLGFLL